MAYYDALKAKWATLSGTTAQKFAALSIATVAQPAPAILTPSQILNACVFADLAGLTQLQVSQLSLLLSGGSVNASIGSAIRLGIQTIFAGKTQTLANLSALVAPFDNATIFWWQSAGYARPMDMGDIAAAGLS